MRNFDKADFDKCLDRLCGVVDGSPSVASSGLQVEVFKYHVETVVVVMRTVIKNGDGADSICSGVGCDGGRK